MESFVKQLFSQYQKMVRHMVNSLAVPASQLVNSAVE